MIVAHRMNNKTEHPRKIILAGAKPPTVHRISHLPRCPPFCLPRIPLLFVESVISVYLLATKKWQLEISPASSPGCGCGGSILWLVGNLLLLRWLWMIHGWIIVFGMHTSSRMECGVVFLLLRRRHVSVLIVINGGTPIRLMRLIVRVM